MKVWINIKGVSHKKNKLTRIEYEYPLPPGDVESLLRETVKICLADYNQRAENRELIGTLSGEMIEEKARSGKVAFGINYGDRQTTLEDAVNNALQSFDDGLVAVFIDGQRKEKKNEPIILKEGSELTFVKLTLLSGRMW